MGIRWMFRGFFSLQLICLVAVVSLFIGSVLMFLIGAEQTLSVVFVFLFGVEAPGNLPSHLSESTLASVGLVRAVDSFLFALVLLIFSYGIYTLFVSNASQDEMDKLPGWLHIANISQLKTTLLQVIIVILAVNLLEHVIVVGPEALKVETLIIPVSVLLLAGALRLMHVPSE
jgi:uncharacterized membrane protein YqhA